MNLLAYVSWVCAGVTWLWLCANISIEWSKNVGFETRRMRKAHMLVVKVCDTVEGASLASEFAKCEDAQGMLTGQKSNLIFKKAFSKTVEGIVNQTLVTSSTISLKMLCAAVISVLLLGGLGMLCGAVSRLMPAPRDERDVLSPVAQQRLLGCSYVDMTRANLVKQD